MWQVEPPVTIDILNHRIQWLSWNYSSEERLEPIRWVDT